ncbi:acyl-CoA dehydrogenase family protein [Nitriliruptor alkaliphilus]|uniref:acyl-CoA dehydrogenase family protein n=1 Tax=Nitriliruptor alkaliphilus TaxID=427918 RepID=UPI000695DC9C|nr:acyl-CoA dehydrogenase family protein [Nitriliruptor alkaliphilus]
MRLRPTDDQQLLTAAVRDFLTVEASADRVRATWQAGGHDAARWKGLADLGVLGVTIPEAAGGLGLGDLDLVGPLIEAGRAALPEPLAEVAAVAAPLLVDAGGEAAEAWLPRIATGDAVVVACLPSDPFPAHVAGSDLLLVADGETIRAVPTAEAAWTAQPTLDGGRPTVRLDTVPDGEGVASGPEARALTAKAERRLAVATAAQLVGVGEAAIDLAVAHAGTREQFGRPIGAFQAVKHHLADALVGVRFALPLVERAAHSVAIDDPGAGVHTALAKATAGEAAEAAVEHALQVHGAIGYTWECDLHLWLKRAYALLPVGGDLESSWQQIEHHLLP